MDYVREALDRANVSLDKTRSSSATRKAAPLGPRPLSEVQSPPSPPWAPRQVKLDPRHLERHRIVSFAMEDPGHMPFNLLRTRVRAMLGENGWKSVGITSPSPGCGKTMVSLNLGFSFARDSDLRTVVMDFDLKRPSLAHALGVTASATVAQVLKGQAELGDCFVQVGSNLILGLGGGHVRESSELIQGPRTRQMLEFIHRTIAPDVVLFDLPPMGVGDDVIAFLPQIDAALLVAAAGQTTIAEIDGCEQQISQNGKFIGVVLNKAKIESKDYYAY